MVHLRTLKHIRPGREVQRGLVFCSVIGRSVYWHKLLPHVQWDHGRQRWTVGVQNVFHVSSIPCEKLLFKQHSRRLGWRTGFFLWAEYLQFMKNVLWKRKKRTYLVNIKLKKTIFFFFKLEFAKKNNVLLKSIRTSKSFFIVFSGQ